jgi:hypothetical protein
MPDDSDKHRAADRSRINIHEERELNYWTKRFGCSRHQLRRAVEKAGPMVEDVQRELAR